MRYSIGEAAIGSGTYEEKAFDLMARSATRMSDCTTFSMNSRQSAGYRVRRRSLGCLAEIWAMPA